MPTKKTAIRRLKRNSLGKLVVTYVDADTGDELDSLDGYEVVASNNNNESDIYFGTDKPVDQPDNGNEGGGNASYTPPPDPNNNTPYKEFANDSSNPAIANSPYLNGDPGQGLKPQGTILGGIIKGAVGQAASAAGSSFIDNVNKIGAQFGLFTGTSAIGSALGINNNEAPNPDGTPKEQPGVLSSFVAGLWNTATAAANGGTPTTTVAPTPAVTGKVTADLTGLTDDVAGVLARAQALVPFEIKVTSGARDPAKNKSVGGAKESQHLSGNAIDISLAGLNDEQRTQLTRALVQAGATRLGAYSGNTAIHMDMKNQGPAPGYPVWPMFDKTIQNMGQAPDWFKAGLDGTQVNPVTRSTQTAQTNIFGNIAGAANAAVSAIGSVLKPASVIKGDPNSDPVIGAYLSLINKQEGAPTAYQAFDYQAYSDLSKHPQIYNKKYDSTAAGMYQINFPTWEEFAKPLGVTDFSESSQNKVAWAIAQHNYKVKTGGGDLYQALISNDPNIVSTAFYKNANRWPSLAKDYPGGATLAQEYLGLRATSAPGDTAFRPVTTPTFTPPQPNAQPFNSNYTPYPTAEKSGGSNRPATEGFASQPSNYTPYNMPSSSGGNNKPASETPSNYSPYQMPSNNAPAAESAGGGFAPKPTNYTPYSMPSNNAPAAENLGSSKPTNYTPYSMPSSSSSSSKPSSSSSSSSSSSKPSSSSSSSSNKNSNYSPYSW